MRGIILLLIVLSGILGGVFGYFTFSEHASDLDAGGAWTGVLTGGGVPLFLAFIFLLVGAMFPKTVSQKKVDEARLAGRTATGQVTAVDTTSMSINDVPVYKVDLVVVPRDHAPYRTSLKRAINPFEVDSFKPGSLLPLVRVEADEEDVAIDKQGVVQAPPPNIIENARDWDEIRTNPFGGQRKKKRRGGWLLRLVIVLLLIWLITVGIAYNVTKGLDERFSSGGVDEVSVVEPAEEEEGDPFYEDAARTQSAVERVTAEYGTDVSEIHFWDTWVDFTVRAQDNPDHWDDVEVDATTGELTNDGAASIQPDEGEYFDVSLIDWDLVLPGLVDQARAALPEGRLGEISVHVWINPIDDTGLREHWIEDFPMPDEFERYDDDTFEFFNDMPKDVASPIKDQLLADAPNTTVRVSLHHDYGSVSLIGNEWGEVYEITND